MIQAYCLLQIRYSHSNFTLRTMVIAQIKLIVIRNLKYELIIKLLLQQLIKIP